MTIEQISKAIAEAPKRIRLSRAKGWRKPEGAVVVARPTKWGNPYRVVREGGFMWVEPEGRRVVCSTDREDNMRERRAEAAALFRERWAPLIDRGVLRVELAGHDLACWCPLDEPCHADVLLELANAPDPGPRS